MKICYVCNLFNILKCTYEKILFFNLDVEIDVMWLCLFIMRTSLNLSKLIEMKYICTRFDTFINFPFSLLLNCKVSTKYFSRHAFLIQMWCSRMKWDIF